MMTHLEKVSGVLYSETKETVCPVKVFDSVPRKVVG